jgi:hypothetical protein
MRNDGRRGRRRTIGPGSVDRIGAQGAQFGAGVLGGGAEAVERVGGEEHRIEPDPRALGALANEGVGAVVGDVALIEQRAVDLIARLQGVAPVDEDRRLFFEHDRHAGRAGEARQPGQPVEGGRHIFVPPFVLVRHDHAVEAQPIERLAQQGQVLAPVRRTADHVEILDHGAPPRDQKAAYTG